LLDDGKTDGTSVSTISECVAVCPCQIVFAELNRATGQPCSGVGEV